MATDTGLCIYGVGQLMDEALKVYVYTLHVTATDSERRRLFKARRKLEGEVSKAVGARWIVKMHHHLGPVLAALQQQTESPAA